MCASPRSLAIIALSACTLMATVGCDEAKPAVQAPVQAQRHEYNATVGKRAIKFSSDASGSIMTSRDKATIPLSSGEVVIDKQKVLVRDKEVADIPEDAKEITVDYTAGKLTISADGKSVHEAQLGE